eukprot:CCRYP_004574-RA/>CCRYP_004574-RA protein AED:0.36 eAED:0.59 QI:0/0/0/1/0/0/2/0/231
MLTEFEELFDGTLGDWNTEPMSLELKVGTKPYHGRAYPISKSRKETTIKELNRLCRLGVLEFQPKSEWVSPSFITTKKHGTGRFLTDFREVNKRLVRKPFPLPKISTVLQELEGFTYGTTLDLNMGYYTIRLEPNSSKICTLIFPWGKYSYLRLPMGIVDSADIFQAKMSALMVALEFVTRANKTKKRPWYWDTVYQKAFDDVKTTIANNVVLVYPDYSREFEIYTDALSK